MKTYLWPILVTVALMFVVAGCNYGPTGSVISNNTGNNSNNQSNTSNNQNNTGSLATTIVPGAVITYTTYGGFISPQFSIKKLTVTKDSEKYEIYSSDNTLVRSITLPADNQSYSRLIKLLNDNNFSLMSDTYGGNNPDVGSYNLTVMQPGFTKTITVAVIGNAPPTAINPIKQELFDIENNILEPSSPDFSMYGYTLLNSTTIDALKSASIVAGPYRFTIPAGTFDHAVKFEVLQASPSLISAYTPSGEKTVLTFALRITDMNTSRLIQDFSGIRLNVASNMIDRHAKLYYVNPSDNYVLAEDYTSTTTLTATLKSAGTSFAITMPGNSTNSEDDTGTGSEPALVSLKSSITSQGKKILVDTFGMTLYTFAADTEQGKSACYGSCAVAWPPVLVSSDTIPPKSSDVDGTIGIIERTDGGYQVTYDNKPLYYFKNDVNPGDTKGDNINGFGGIWHIVRVSQ